MNWERTVRRKIRRSADIIGLTMLASVALNYLLYPLTGLLPDFAEGSLGYELLELILYLFIFVTPFAVGAKLSGMSACDLLGEERPSAEVYLMTIGLILGWSLAAGFLGAGMEGILNQFGVTEPVDAYVLPVGKAALAVQFVSTAILPPIVEELCFRGFYFNTAERSMGTWPAICLTASCFWMAHYSIEIMPLAVGFGVIGGYIRRRYGSLLPSMCAHFAVNTIYLIVNIGYAAGGDVMGTVLSVVIDLAEVLLGAVGLMLFIRRGSVQEIWRRQFGRPAALPTWQIAAAVLTSVPVLLVLLETIYFTSGNLEVLSLP